MVGHGGSSAGSYLADPTSPIPSHCASIVVTSTLSQFNISSHHNESNHDIDGSGDRERISLFSKEASIVSFYCLIKCELYMNRSSSQEALSAPATMSITHSTEIIGTAFQKAEFEFCVY